MYHLSLLILEPKGAKRRQKEAQRQPKGAKKEAEGSPGGRKIEKKSRFFLARVSGGEKMGRVTMRDSDSRAFGFHFGFILGAKFDDFSCYFLASFFDRFLKASGGILGGILDDFGRSFWLLFLTMRKKAHPTNSLEITMQIKGRAPGKATKKRSKIKEKTV